MDPRPAPHRVGEEGLASVQFVVAAGLAMLLVVGMVQVVAYQYVRGAVTTALERGVRAGTVVGAGADECRAVIADSLSEVLGGVVGESILVGCSDGPVMVEAWARGTVPAWLPGTAGFVLDIESVARREPMP